MLKKQILKKENKVKVTFVIPSDMENSSVVGDFNEWDPTSTPLKKRSNGTRSATVLLAPNQRYAFRYYTQDGQWFNEEESDEYVVNEHGGKNCIVCTF